MDNLDLLQARRAALCSQLRADADHGPGHEGVKQEVADLNDRIATEIGAMARTNDRLPREICPRCGTEQPVHDQLSARDQERGSWMNLVCLVCGAVVRERWMLRGRASTESQPQTAPGQPTLFAEVAG